MCKQHMCLKSDQQAAVANRMFLVLACKGQRQRLGRTKEKEEAQGQDRASMLFMLPTVAGDLVLPGSRLHCNRINNFSSLRNVEKERVLRTRITVCCMQPDAGLVP